MSIRMLSIWNSLVSYKMFQTVCGESREAIIMAHPATDVLSWNQYLTDQGVWIIAVIAVVAMMYIMAT
jgi:hypothetical protein